MDQPHRYGRPDRFVSGVVGCAEERVFFVQIREGSRMTNVVCEPEQIRVLAEHISRVLSELERFGILEESPVPVRSRDNGPLDVPLDEDFRAGTMVITWLPDSASLKIELFAMGVYLELAHPGIAGDHDEVMQAIITPDQARQFVARTGELLGSTAPSCPFCGQPILADGHLCPRSNGYRKPLIDFVRRD